MRKILLSTLAACFALTSVTMAQASQSQYKYSYKYQQKQESQAKNQYRKQYQHKSGNAYQGTNPNMGSMGSGMKMGGGRH